MNFTQCPDWYDERISRMYRTNTPRIKKCPDYRVKNHLIKPCKYCLEQHPNLRKRFAEPVVRSLFKDREYYIWDDPFVKLCLKRFISKGFQLYTGVEFPTPKICSQHITRVPQFYEPATRCVYDCYSSLEELDKFSNPYYITKAHKVCSKYGLTYVQMLVTDYKFMVVHRQPIAVFDDISHRLLTSFYRTPKSNSKSKVTKNK